MVTLAFVDASFACEVVGFLFGTCLRFRRAFELVFVPLKARVTYLFHAFEQCVVIDWSYRRTGFTFFGLFVPNWSQLWTNLAAQTGCIPNRSYVITFLRFNLITLSRCRIEYCSLGTKNLALFRIGIPLGPSRTSLTSLSGTIENRFISITLHLRHAFLEFYTINIIGRTVRSAFLCLNIPSGLIRTGDAFLLRKVVNRTGYKARLA